MSVSFSIVPPPPRSEHRVLLPLLGTVFCAVITLQSIGWWKLVERLNSEVASHARVVVRRDEVPWTAGTPANHWSMPALVALKQGRQPSTYLAFNRGASVDLRSGKIRLGVRDTISAEPGPAGWFDHRPLLERLASESGKAR